MGTLASELMPVAERVAPVPRVYADANLPLGAVTAMRTRLGWDVLFVVEHDDLRRARDTEHYRRAREQGRTLLTFDRDFFDDRRFPPDESGGVIVLSAPNDRALVDLLGRLDRELLRDGYGDAIRAPLAGRKLHWHSGTRLA